MFRFEKLQGKEKLHVYIKKKKKVSTYPYMHILVVLKNPFSVKHSLQVLSDKHSQKEKKKIQVVFFHFFGSIHLFITQSAY